MSNGPGQDSEAHHGRHATEVLLEDTAVALVRDQGVLAGLNLQEVAERAGVNRGLIYHYYGSRGALLRQAFQRRVGPLLEFVDSVSGLPFRPRVKHWFEGMVLHRAEIRLAALLLLDGTAPIRVMPRLRETQQGLADDVEAGSLDPGVDRQALNVLVPAALYGYVMFRDAFAAELGLTTEQLDRRVWALWDRLLATLAP